MSSAGCIPTLQPKGTLAISATFVLHQAIEAFTSADKVELRGTETAVVTCKLHVIWVHTGRVLFLVPVPVHVYALSARRFPYAVCIAYSTPL